MTTIKTSLILLLLTLVGASCSDNKSINQSNSFLFPEVIDTMQMAIYYYSPSNLTTPINYIKTIERIGNEANLNDSKIDYNSFIDDYNLSDTTNKSIVVRTGISLLVDTTREVSIDIDEGIIPAPFFDHYPDNNNDPRTQTQKLIDSLTYAIRRQDWEENTFLVKGFPVYIVNNSKKTVRIEEQDRRLMIIQEALDTSGQWKPIDIWKFSECGNSYGGIALRPGYYIMTKMFKYKGAFETMIRLKMLNDTIVYYSQPFSGSINLAQMDSTLIKFRPREFFVIDKKAK